MAHRLLFIAWLAAWWCLFSVARGAYLIEIDTDGRKDGVIAWDPDFGFGGDSIFGGNGSAFPDTYVYTRSPESQADNLNLDAGMALGDGNFASGAGGGVAGRYAVYASWPATTNVGGGPTSFEVVTAGDRIVFSIDQNTKGNVWVKLGEIDYASGPITVTQTAGVNEFVSMRAAGVLFERLADGEGEFFEGPPGPFMLGEGVSWTFGLAFPRPKLAAETTHFRVLHSTDLVNWSTSDLKLVSISGMDPDTELVAFRSMLPVAAADRQFLKVMRVPRMPLGDPPKYLAMTYDDGPHPDRTPRLLDMLAARNIRATFYVIGSNAVKYPRILRRMLNEGHEIGNHTLNHPRLTELTEEQVIAEVAGCRDAVVAAATLPTPTIRPPYGAMNSSLRELFMSEFGYPTILWDVDPRDWDGNVSDQQVIDTILGQSKHRDIVLCHDIHERTIEVMPPVLDGLLARGFSFVTVTEWLDLAGE